MELVKLDVWKEWKEKNEYGDYIELVILWLLRSGYFIFRVGMRG